MTTIPRKIIGVSGIAGSFSEEAARRYAESAHMIPELVYLMDMELSLIHI